MMLKHTIYFTIAFVLLLGFIIGLIMATEEFKIRVEPEKFTLYDKGKAIFTIIIYSITVYLAGIEYHELKKKLKK